MAFSRLGKYYGSYLSRLVRGFNNGYKRIFFGWRNHDQGSFINNDVDNSLSHTPSSEGILNMQKDPIRSQMSASDWGRLAPRSSIPAELWNILDGKPIRVSGRCGHCDSSISEEWCTATSPKNCATEIRHLADPDIAILRRSELALIEAILS